MRVDEGGLYSPRLRRLIPGSKTGPRWLPGVEFGVSDSDSFRDSWRGDSARYADT